MSQVSTRPDSPNSIDRQEFEKWMTAYKKHYDTDDEKERRFKAFQQHLREIEAHNALQTTWTKGLNRFSDLTLEEFRNNYGGTIPSIYPPNIITKEMFRETDDKVEDYVIPYDFKGYTRRSSMADQGASSSTGRGKRLRGAEPDPPSQPPRRRIRYSSEEVQPVDGEEPVNIDTRCHLDKWIANPSNERKLNYPDHLHSKNSQLIKPSGVAMSQVSTRPGSPNSIDRQEFEKWMTKYNIHYDTEDQKERRFKVFQQVLHEIEVENAFQTRYIRTLNPFSDMTPDELMVEYRDEFPIPYASDITEEKIMEHYKDAFMEKDVWMPGYHSNIRKNTDDYVIPYDSQGYPRSIEDYMIPYDFEGYTRSSSNMTAEEFKKSSSVEAASSGEKSITKEPEVEPEKS